MAEYVEEFVLSVSMKLIVIFLQSNLTIGILDVNETTEKKDPEGSRENPSKNRVNIHH